MALPLDSALGRKDLGGPYGYGTHSAVDSVVIPLSLDSCLEQITVPTIYTALVPSTMVVLSLDVWWWRKCISVQRHACSEAVETADMHSREARRFDPCKYTARRDHEDGVPSDMDNCNVPWACGSRPAPHPKISSGRSAAGQDGGYSRISSSSCSSAIRSSSMIFERNLAFGFTTLSYSHRRF